MHWPILDDYLLDLIARGRSTATVARHKCWLNRFLLGRGVSLRLEHLRIEDVDAFALQWLPSLARSSRNGPLAVIRGFLRFLHQRNVIGIDLAAQVVGVRAYRDARIVRGVERSRIKEVIEAIDRGTPSGRRDYAVLMLLASYGLRASEVASLTLDSIDWEHDSIRIEQFKTKNALTLPLLPEVGNAIVDFLWHRPAVRTNNLFCFEQKNKAEPVRKAVVKHMRNARIDFTGRPTSLFRHSLAMEMVGQQVPLKYIADIFGHRSLAATYVYARSDVERLRPASLPVVIPAVGVRET